MRSRSGIEHFMLALGRVISGLLLAVVVAIVSLRWLPPLTTSYMLQSAVKPVQYQWVPMAKISPLAGNAVIASEDQKFRLHHGFDVEAIQQAYEKNQKRKHRRGASTISQQTAKNLFLWPEGGYLRKGLEAALTVLIEFAWGKDRILEIYLNVAEFGPGIYGVEAASRSYFGKPASALTAPEAARLAAVLPNPRHWSAKNPGPYVQQRANWILGQMGYGRKSEQPEDEIEPVPFLIREGEPDDGNVENAPDSTGAAGQPDRSPEPEAAPADSSDGEAAPP